MPAEYGPSAKRLRIGYLPPLSAGKDLHFSPEIADDELEARDEVLCADISSESWALRTLVFLDWDDTLLPSTWLLQQNLQVAGSCVVSETQSEQLRAIAEHVLRTIYIAKQLGRVVIVTNAERGWVELTCSKFMPSVVPLIENLQICSARSTYEPLGAIGPKEWKRRAFSQLIVEHLGEQRANTISLGDAVHDREAFLCAAKGILCWRKSIKLMVRPSIDELVRQHQEIQELLLQVSEYEGNLDLHLRRSGEF